jgi:acetyl esterase
MPLHPQAKQVLEVMASLGLSLTGDDAAAVRKQMESFPRPEGEPVAKVEDRMVPGPGGDIPVRVYTPANATGAAMVWYHGGGWVIGSVDGSDAGCRAFANASGATVVSVEYRLAPEHKYPAAADDCYAATLWVAENAASLGINPDKLAVGGDSAGGNLAAVVAQLAKAEGAPKIGFQFLVYPVTDHDYSTQSYSDNADGYLLTKESMVWFWNHYLSHEGDGKHPKASPAKAVDLTGLPPALVLTAEFDPLRDEGEAYAARLRSAGVHVEMTRYPGQIHGFYAIAAMDDGKKAIAQGASALKRILDA